MWIRLLDVFSNTSRIVEVFISQKAAAVVMGTMAAHGGVLDIQKYGCYLLSKLAAHVPVGNEKVICLVNNEYNSPRHIVC